MEGDIKSRGAFSGSINLGLELRPGKWGPYLLTRLNELLDGHHSILVSVHLLQGGQAGRTREQGDDERVLEKRIIGSWSFPPLQGPQATQIQVPGRSSPRALLGPPPGGRGMCTCPSCHR